ncbi:hypothetical protein CDO44_04385 [Pigmentiphaga sp. NML080357]|uniref:hypothetical protein n=1 Tax=Pigmentiphaga sp. NML080357 TaxID=2008675 RepID=UPI000B40E061|nr:hypothetical protein [Pigmentiphaga sp. NML080357]OVZ62418.1 hypothetical protein CDO44_04385 [Pigmentiphaga sp. NML080357]
MMKPQNTGAPDREPHPEADPQVVRTPRRSAQAPAEGPDDWGRDGAVGRDDGAVGKTQPAPSGRDPGAAS